MGNSIDKKVNAAFSSGSEAVDYGKEFAAELRGTWRDLERLISRNLGFILAVAAAFEILRYNTGSEVTLLFVKVPSNNLIVAALPPILAYLYLSVTISLTESELMRQTHEATIRALWRPLYDNDLERNLAPANALTGPADRMYLHFGGNTREGNLSQLSTGARPVAALVAPPAFLVVAYAQSFGHLGFDDPAVWISAVASALLLIGSFINVYLLFKA
jgi:hypothetical protein